MGATDADVVADVAGAEGLLELSVLLQPGPRTRAATAKADGRAVVEIERNDMVAASGVHLAEEVGAIALEGKGRAGTFRR